MLHAGFLYLRRAGATLRWGERASPCGGFSLLWSTGCRHVGSVVVAHGLSCSTACRIFPDQGSNPCPLHWQAYSFFFFLILFIYLFIWLCWVFVAVRGLSLVVVSGGYSSLRCAGFSLRWLLLLRSTGSRRVGLSCCGTQAQ